MTVAIHQPNFCPWLGFFAKILRSDCFVLLDDVQFSKNSWTNRVRIKTPRGAQWLSVPVLTAGRFGQRINEVETNNGIRWRQKLCRSIEMNYTRAPHFRACFPAIETAVLNASLNLCSLNIRLIETVVGMLDLDVRFIRSSALPSAGRQTDRLVSIVGAVNGSVYLSGDGAEYQEDDKFLRAGIRLRKNSFRHPVYPQLWGEFVPGLSALDALFNLGAEGTRQLLLDERAANAAPTAPLTTEVNA